MFSSLSPLVGTPPMQTFGQVLDSTARLLPGTIVAAVDNWWGYGEFIYARASATITQYALCAITPTFSGGLSQWRYNVTEIPNTTLLGRPVCVAMKAMSIGDLGWFMISGLTPVDCNASVAADTTFGIAAAGQGGAVANGKQIVNARIAAAASTTVDKTAVCASGSTILHVNNSDGWFPGVYLSGTGVAAGATVSAISADGREVTMSAAATALINGTVTATYNNATIFYNVAHLNRSFAQGQIT